MRDLTVFPDRWLEYEPPGYCHDAIAKILGGGGAPKLPPPPPVLPMPDINDPAILMEQRRAGAASRSGRASTILSGQDYSGSTLGVP